MKDPRAQLVDRCRNIPGRTLKETRYLIASNVLESIRTFDSENDEELMASVDSSVLLTERGALRKGLECKRDYEDVDEDTWNMLVQMFCVGPPIPREVIAEGPNGKLVLELYPLSLEIQLMINGEAQGFFPSNIMTVSKSCTMREFFDIINVSLQTAQLQYVVCRKEVEICYDGSTREVSGAQLGETMEKLGVVDNSGIVIEVKPRTPSRSGIINGGQGPQQLQSLAPVSPNRPRAGSSVSSDTSPPSTPPTPGTPPRAPPRVASTCEPPYGYVIGKGGKTFGPGTLGLSGLRNLGNTCYMNSALQCLSNTPGLTNYFRSRRWQIDINKDNPIGHCGKLAESYGDLIRRMWAPPDEDKGYAGRPSWQRDSGRYCSPDQFKSMVGSIREEFAGYAQHDSQEFANFLLDGLHEDLNLVLKKPAVESKEPNGRPDSVVAAEAWCDYLQRNQSYVVDQFGGLYKSTTECDKCSKVSIKFDPFMMLTLGLASETQQQVIIPVTVIFAVCPETGVAPKPVIYSCRLPASASVKDLRKRCAALCGKHPDTLFLAETWDHKIYSTYDDRKPVCEIAARDDVVAWELVSTITAPMPLDTVLSPTTPCAPTPSVSSPNSWPTPSGPSPTTSSGDLESTPLKPHFQRENHRVLLVISHAVDPLESSYSLHSHRCVKNPSVVPLPQAALSNSDLYRIVLESSPWNEEDAAAEQARADQTNAFPFKLTAKRAFPPSGYQNSCQLCSVFSCKGCPIPLPATPLQNTGSNSISDTGDADADHDMGAQILRLIDDDTANDGDPGLTLDRAGNLPAPRSSPTSPTDIETDMQVCEGNSATAPVPLFTTLLEASWALLLKKYHSKQPPSPNEPILIQLHAVWNKAALDHRPHWLDDKHEFETHESVASDKAWKEAMEHKGKEALTLEDCFKLFTSRERLTEDNAWFCPKCKELRQAYRTMNLFKAPRVLVVHLKRFSQISAYYRKKLDTLVTYPVEGLDIGQWLAPDRLEQGEFASSHPHTTSAVGASTIYDLYGVSNHYGGMGGGHYTATCLNDHNGRWYQFDDASVTLLPSPPEPATCAYMLFYKLRGADDNHDQSVPESAEATPNPGSSSSSFDYV